ncbi:hypothetical protein EI555_017791, partial [Monodon monoceros]
GGEGPVELCVSPGGWGGGSEGDVRGDAKPSRDRELQSDAAFGAVVTRAMASKEEQVMKNINMENANEENDKKDEKEQVANKGEPLALPSESGEYCVPGGNDRRFHVRQPILQYRWDMTQSLEEPQARMREENMERIGEEMRQLMQKLREKQLSHSLR